MRQLLRDYFAYGLVSAVAFGVDFGLLMLLTRQLHLHYVIANTVSFISGATVAYLLSVRFVFHYHRLTNRRSEFASFVLLGVVGYLVNSLVLAGLNNLPGSTLELAKIGAAGCTLTLNFVLRRQFLFAPKPGTPPPQESVR
jgi:putative flippase GtrA